MNEKIIIETIGGGYVVETCCNGSYRDGKRFFETKTDVAEYVKEVLPK